MITFLRGVLHDNVSSQITIDVNGVGYEVIVPFTSIDKIGKPGDEVTVLTHHHIREQEQTLYGFSSADERDVFRLLINRVSGVGPKVAMSVLSGMSVMDFKGAVVNGDLAAIAKVKGLGKKTAERIVLELKDKVGVAEAWKAVGDSVASPEMVRHNDVVLALISLGYKQSEAAKAATSAAKAAGDDAGVEDLIRAALGQMQ